MERPQEKDTAALRRTLRRLCATGPYTENRKFIMHGTTTVYDHCLAVAYFSLWLDKAFHLGSRRHDLLKGALLHDYFLYDWHEPGPSRRLHGFTHPSLACRNAVRDYHIDERTQNIIRRHMFPLVPVPPDSREAWLVCIADKTCALAETLKLNKPFFNFISYKPEDYR